MCRWRSAEIMMVGSANNGKRRAFIGFILNAKIPQGIPSRSTIKFPVCVPASPNRDSNEGVRFLQTERCVSFPSPRLLQRCFFGVFHIPAPFTSMDEGGVEGARSSTHPSVLGSCNPLFQGSPGEDMCTIWAKDIPLNGRWMLCGTMTADWRTVSLTLLGFCIAPKHTDHRIPHAFFHPKLG